MSFLSKLEPGVIATMAAVALAGVICMVGVELWNAATRGAQARAATPVLVAAVPGIVSATHKPAQVEAVARTRGDRTNVTVFERAAFELPDGRHMTVVTGLVYDHSDSDTPSHQFCYMEVGNMTQAADVTINLAKKQDGQIERQDITQGDSRIVKAPVKVIEGAVTACRFV